MTVAYDGTDFHGWQRQPDLRTAQGELERALGETLGTPITTVAAGRTDRGVHARGQVVSFRAGTTLPARALVPLVGRHLPADLAARDAAETGAEFDARRSAIGRRYVYRLLDQDDPLWRRYAWHPTRPLDPAGLARATGPLVGEHDFASFEASGSSPTATVCRLSRADWRRWETGWMLELVADHFLYHMVRNIVGTALTVMREPDPGAAMRVVLDARRRGAAGATAPPEGLCLEEVLYPS